MQAVFALNSNQLIWDLIARNHLKSKGIQVISTLNTILYFFQQQSLGWENGFQIIFRVLFHAFQSNLTTICIHVKYWPHKYIERSFKGLDNLDQIYGTSSFLQTWLNSYMTWYTYPVEFSKRFPVCI